MCIRDSLYTINKLSEREIKETIPFTIASKRIKYLGINLPKEVKDLYSENYKTLMKKIEDDTNRWKDTMFLDWKNHYCENDYIAQSNYRFNVIPIKLPMAFFTELEQKNLKICMETQKTPDSQSSLEGKKPSWRNQTP